MSETCLFGLNLHSDLCVLVKGQQNKRHSDRLQTETELGCATDCTKRTLNLLLRPHKQRLTVITAICVRGGVNWSDTEQA